jgi:hypothetical protein
MTIAPSRSALEANGLRASLDMEQAGAATLPDGPAQIIAPAGSGKTTTLIARLGVLLTRGVAPDRIAVVPFNREAAEELRSRIRVRLAPLVPGPKRSRSEPCMPWPARCCSTGPIQDQQPQARPSRVHPLRERP